VCRFASLDVKAYWYDEAFTSLQISGYSPSDAKGDILTGRQISISDLKKYQNADSSSGKTVADTVHGLAIVEPQLTPLYFIAARLWAQWFGSSAAAIRGLSVLFSLLTLPFAAWLCLELFESWRICWFCVALMSVSPFHVLYAQEARPYSMWAALTLLSSVLLLRAARKQTAFGWILYCLSVVVSLYTYLFSLLVVAGHGLYVAIANRFRFTRAVLMFIGSSCVAIALFLPWPYRGQSSGSGNEAYSLGRYLTKWVRNVSVFFVDFDLSDGSAGIYLAPFILCVLALILLVGYSIYFLYRRAPLRSSAFVLSLIFTLALSVCSLDLVAGSSRALVTRYLYPSFLGIQIAVAFLLAMKTDAPANPNGGAFWRTATVLVLGLGIVSCGMIARAEEWWTKAPENYTLRASRIINRDKAPLVVSDAWFVRILSLEHKLRSDARFQLTASPNMPEISEDDKVFFAYQPSPHLLAELSLRYDMKMVDAASRLWCVRHK
jgi:uncharacterized membrane protein